ncbi:MAG: hypothetical protein F4060_07535 [Holophagales bacterium]|nr:hypothetical protein [Holophagales bacterium]MYG29704.1 hypothetical protein [Holophagales bacterium]MYI79778.1 hypothetical protein [Holophagales bacterium]
MRTFPRSRWNAPRARWRSPSGPFRTLGPCFCLLVCATAASGQPGDLFAPAGPELPGPLAIEAADETPTANDNIAVRSRTVTLNFGVLQRVRAAAESLAEGPASLALNLFDDIGYEAVIEHVAPTFSGGYSLSGRIAGEPLSSATLVVNGPTVAGSVRMPGAVYRIGSAGDGRYFITEVDESKLPECGLSEAEHAELGHDHELRFRH